MSRVTLKSIAAETGLSKFAVSRALAGKSGVSEETRVRVSEAAARLGYKKPAPAGRTTFGIVFDDTEAINSELYMQIQSGAQREAQRLGLSVRIHWTHDPDELDAFIHDSAGLLMVGPHDPRAVARARASGKPLVRNGWLEPLEPVDQIGGTDCEAGSAVAKYLLRLGHRDIAYVHGDTRYRGRMERLYGLREVMEMLDDVRLRDMTWPDDQSFAQALDRLGTADAFPTAFFCAHDGIAVTVISELRARGYRIPEDASVVGFGDFSAAQQILPQLTTVKMPGFDIGAMSVHLLRDRVESSGRPSTPMRLHLTSHIVERQSAGPAPQPAKRLDATAAVV
ncbi:LacI family DNA-binding transcriptional regulator [Consotaella aegiceratis]|uniref:LacI family DNA-binding transcriptional regulator n=1 Tax=Consotaella aegiceratis TaxID=3097961 RepID=UPI002F41BB01